MSRRISSKWQKTLKLKMVCGGIKPVNKKSGYASMAYYSQGWLYSKGITEEDFLRWAEQHL